MKSEQMSGVSKLENLKNLPKNLKVKANALRSASSGATASTSVPSEKTHLIKNRSGVQQPGPRQQAVFNRREMDRGQVEQPMILKPHNLSANEPD